MTRSEADLPVAIGFAALGYLLAGLGPYLLVLGGELHRDTAHLVWLSSAFGAGLLIVAATGPVLLRAGAGRILRAAALVMATGVAVLATVPALPAAGTGALLVGLGGAAAVLVAPALIHGPTAAARLTRINGIASVAGILAPLSIGALERAGIHGRLALLIPLPALLVLAARRSVAGSPAATVPRALAVSPGAAVARQSAGSAHPGAPAPQAPAAPQVGPVPAGRPARRRVAAAYARIVLAVSAEFCFVVWGVARIRDAGASGAAAAALGTAFPVGMAAGRLLGHRRAGHPAAVPAGVLTAVLGTCLGALGRDPWTVTAGLAVAGLGIAVLYPVMLARLAATPGLAARHSSSLGALASGTAILGAPALLAGLGEVASLRVAFLLPVPLLAALLSVDRT